MGGRAGKLKQSMRAVIRGNRTKHKLHNSLSNIAVIREIGQMWWNPKNSRNLRGDRTSGDANVGRKSLGLRVRFWDGPPSTATEEEEHAVHAWRLGWIAEYDAERQLHLVSLDGGMDGGGGGELPLEERGAWLDFALVPHMLASGIVWAKLPGYRWWPAQVFKHCALLGPECDRRAKGECRDSGIARATLPLLTTQSLRVATSHRV